LVYRQIGTQLLPRLETGRRKMPNTLVKAMQRAAIAALLTASVAACSTPGTQTASLSSTGHVRSWADWSDSAPQQTAALPQAHGWVDSAQVPVGADTANEMISNSGRGN
jgi:hypothetical protein